MTFSKCKIPYCCAKANHMVLVKGPNACAFQLRLCHWHTELVMFNPVRVLANYPGIMPKKARALLKSK